MRKFIFIVDGEVASDLIFEDQGEGPKFEGNRMFAAALLSNPVIMEIPTDSPVKNGWLWDGKDFRESEI